MDAAAERILAAREPIGWKLGLERMQRLCSLLGMPQRRFASAHIVGTNGKSSTTRFIARLVAGSGQRSTGAYLSPHLDSWRERIEIDGKPIGEDLFLSVLEQAERAAVAADRAAGEGEGPVTQYELLTAAAFCAFAEAGVEVAAIEAGLGGRLDATNVLPSKVTVLTSVGLDHTEWLGETVAEIAAEKLAVLRDHSVLVTGPDPSSWVEPVVEEFVADRHARWVIAEPAGPEDLPPFQRRNLGLAVAATEALVGEVSQVVREMGSEEMGVRGRLEWREGDPPVVLDAAHNPDAARALAEALPALCSGAPVVCCLAVLDDKDASGMIEALAGVCGYFICTEIAEEQMKGTGRPGAKCVPASDLADLCVAFGATAEAVSEPSQAISRAQELAKSKQGVAVVTGSHYLLGAYG